MARIVTAAARDFGDVLDGDDSDDNLDGPASISNLSTPVKPPLNTSTTSTPNSMTASTPNKSSLSASSSSDGSTASGSAAKASAGGGAAYKQQQQQQSYGSRARGDDVVEGIANALSSDEEEFSMAASPRSPNGPPLYTPNKLKSSPPAKPTTKPELLVFTVDSQVFTVDSPPPPASHSDSNESSEPTTTRAAGGGGGGGGRSILGGLFGFGKSSSSGSSSSSSSNPNPKPSAAHEGVVVGAGVGVGSSSGGGAHAGAGTLGLRELRIEVSEGPVGIVWGDVPPPFSDPSLGGAVGVFVFSLKPGGRAERAGVLVGDVLVSINGKAEPCMHVLTTAPSRPFPTGAYQRQGGGPRESRTGLARD